MKRTAQLPELTEGDPPLVLVYYPFYTQTWRDSTKRQKMWFTEVYDARDGSMVFQTKPRFTIAQSQSWAQYWISEQTMNRP